MPRFDESVFAVYFNTINKYVTIHKTDRHVLEPNQGGHNNQQGGWGYFVTRFEADEFANSVSTAKKLPFQCCRKCFKS